MSKAIETKFIPCTNTKGSRVKAFDMDGNSVTLSYPHQSDDPHKTAALALCLKMGWKGTLVRGGTTRGEVFVWVDEHELIKTLEESDHERQD